MHRVISRYATNSLGRVAREDSILGQIQAGIGYLEAGVKDMEVS